ncbi:MAG: MBG domain-containing protein [Bacteroidales bacterium]
MRRLLLSLFFVAFLFGSNTLRGQTSTAPAAGDGSAANPYEIATLENLYWIAEDNTRWGFSYKQTADIDASETSSWFSGAGWTPIGNNTNKFTGSYEGFVHKISGLYISRSSTQYIGLFGYIDAASVSYLELENVQITGSYYTGGLIGYANTSSSIVGCHVQGTVIGYQVVGGISGIINNSTSVRECSASVSLKSRNVAGGLVGMNHGSSSIEQCYSNGSVAATTSEESGDYGGLVGHNYASIISSYSRCKVVAGMSAGGGFVGNNGGSISECYSTGSVTPLGGAEYYGGFVGYNSGTVTSCYWDTELSGNSSSDAGTGKTSAEMKDQTTYVGWDFDMLPVWQISSRYYEGYPFFTWMPMPLTPQVSTESVDNITGIKANVYGKFTGLGTTDPTQYGFCWSTSQYPTTADSKVDLGATSEIISFSSVIEGLSVSTTYYVRAYAVNNNGTSYGEQLSFTTLPLLGSGTVDDPYQISNLVQLKYVHDNSSLWSASFIQTADIDAAETSTWNSGAGWKPLTNFTGSYNGQNYSISNLYINRPSSSNIGFIASAQNATIQNLNLVDVDITGSFYVGVLIANIYNGTTVSNVNCTGQVTASSTWAGGFYANAYGGTTTNSSTSVSVSGSEKCGGFIGENQYSSSISNCKSSGNVISTANSVGGFVGYNFGDINACLSLGDVSGVQGVGGFVGYGGSKPIANCYSMGNASGTSYVGGFAGKNDGKVYTCYSTGTVTASTYKGGFMGMNFTGVVTNCFWDKTSSGLTTSPAGTGKTTAEMNLYTTFTNATWDFKGLGTEGIWNIGNTRNSGYPYFDWEYPSDKALQVITFNTLDSKTYGDAGFDLTATSTSGLGVSYVSSNESVVTISGSTVTIVGAGTVNITASQDGNSEYNPAGDVVQSLTINKKDLTISAEDKTKTYDGSGFTNFASTYSGFVNSENESVLGGTLTYAGTAMTATNAGTYIITPQGLTSDNYTITFTDGSLEIGKAALTVTAEDKSKTYDGSVYGVFTSTYAGFVNGENESALGGTLTYVGTATTAIDAGSYTITPQGLTSDNYAITFMDGSLEIGKAALTVTAEDKSKIYDGSIYGVFTSAYAGFVNGENESALGGTLTYAGTATNAIDAGTYTITPQGLTSDNYTITFMDGSLEIGKAALTVTAEDKSKTYDGSVFTNFTSSYGGFVNGENESALGGTLTYAGTAMNAIDVGTYTITPQGLTSDNYAITFMDGSLEIGKAALTVTAEDKSKTYDGSVYGVFTSAYAGFVNGENESVLSGTLTYAGTATTATNAGTYIITPQGLTSDNYAITFANGSLEIGKAALRVTAEDKSKTYNGSVYGVFTSTYGGFVNGENESVLGGTLTYTGTATTAIDAGSYTISPQGLTSDNYTITFTDGSLEIDKAALTVTAEAKSKIYDGSIYGAFTSAYAGFVNGEDESALGGTLTYAGTATNAIDAGTYTITPQGLTSDNYTITFTDGSLEIGKAALTVTAEDKSKTYDGSVYGVFTSAYGGFVNGENESALGGALTYAGTATNAIDAGTYTITPQGLTSDNYTITFMDGSLEIGKAALTVTSEDKSKTYDGSVYGVFTSAYAGFVNGENESVLGGTLTYAGTATTATNAGTYTITPQGITSDNYTITFMDGSLEIGKAILTATADNKSKYVGEDNPAFTITYSGFVNSEDVSVIEELPVASTSANNESIAGNYDIVLTGGADNNYSFNLVKGVLAVIDYPTYTVTFNVSSNDNAIAGATITINNTEIVTNSSGMSTISLVDGNYSYSVVANGFENASGEITVNGADFTKTVVLTPVPPATYTVTFTVLNGSNGIEDATIQINGSELTTDVTGIATIELVDGNYSYVITKSGYETVNNQVVVNGANVNVSVSLQPTGIDDTLLSELKVFPNPFLSTINIVNALNLEQVIIANIAGVVIANYRFVDSDTHELKPELTPGIYIVSFIAKDGTRVVKKMIKQ